MTLELNRHCGEDLADLLLAALGAHGDGVIVKRLHLREIVSAILATVVISGHLRTPFITNPMGGITIHTMTRRKVILIPSPRTHCFSLSERSERQPAHAFGSDDRIHWNIVIVPLQQPGIFRAFPADHCAACRARYSGRCTR